MFLGLFWSMSGEKEERRKGRERKGRITESTNGEWRRKRQMSERQNKTKELAATTAGLCVSERGRAEKKRKREK